MGLEVSAIDLAVARSDAGATTPTLDAASRAVDGLDTAERALRLANQFDRAGVSQSLRGRDIICFSHDWTGDPLSKTHLMRLLARDNRVLWVNSIGYRAPRATARDLRRIIQKLQAAAQPLREVEQNLFVLSPLAIPAWGSSVIRQVNATLLAVQVRRAMRKLGFSRPLGWYFNPAAGVLAGRLGEERIIYYCVDEYTAFSGVASTALAAVERELIDKADYLFVSSERLLNSKRSSKAPTILIRHGVDYELFRRATLPETKVPEGLARLNRPIIGYFGLISEDWVDVPLLVQVARRFPAASLVLLGKIAMDVSPLAQEPNVHLLGRQPYESLPAFCRGFDVALIPFPVSEVTLNANPLKAREYLAAGLPVVSTSIPEVAVLPHCLLADTPERFCVAIAEALRDPGPSPVRSHSMRTESWQARLDEIRQHFDAGERHRLAAESNALKRRPR
jgi:glycosyltransferase involved in cell wall biosynthesis